MRYLILTWALLVTLAAQAKEPAKEVKIPSSLGTAFLVSDYGQLVTSYHTIKDKAQILLGPLHNNQWMVAKVVHTDPETDLALLQANILRPGLSIASWSTVPIGLEVFVVGYPQPDVLGMTAKITQGIINGHQPKTGMFQLSAEVQKGNSGGPVLAPDGSVVGVVTSKLNALNVAARTKDLPQNVNYALPSEVLLKFLKDAGVRIEDRRLDLTTQIRPYQMYKKVEFSIFAVVGRNLPDKASSSAKKD